METIYRDLLKTIDCHRRISRVTMRYCIVVEARKLEMTRKRFWRSTHDTLPGDCTMHQATYMDDDFGPDMSKKTKLKTNSRMHGKGYNF